MTKSIVQFTNIIIAAILAGTSFGIWIGFNPLHLSLVAYIEQQQNTIRSLNTIMMSLVVAATIITLISAFLQKKNRSVFIALLLSAAFFISCMIISRFGNQPINNIILSWTADSFPSNWYEFRDQWWNYHILRTIAELISLVLVTWTGIRKD